MKPITPQQQRILDFLERYVRAHGYSPTYDEIRQALGLSTKSLVSHHLKRLQAQGYLELRHNSPRSIHLLGPRRAATFCVPLAGQIAAGEPISFGDWENDFVELTRDIVDEQEGLYALRVKGNSMIDSLIYDGDLVIVKHQQHAQDGDMVAVRLIEQDETTLKHFFYEKNRVRLQPANPAMRPLYFHPANVQVQGKVVAVIRQVA
ncbi:MAG: transcriptional repressor LexA [Chloroflexota bacterium]